MLWHLIGQMCSTLRSVMLTCQCRCSAGCTCGLPWGSQKHSGNIWSCGRLPSQGLWIYLAPNPRIWVFFSFSKTNWTGLKIHLQTYCIVLLTVSGPWNSQNVLGIVQPALKRQLDFSPPPNLLAHFPHSDWGSHFTGSLHPTGVQMNERKTQLWSTFDAFRYLCLCIWAQDSISRTPSIWILSTKFRQWIAF